MLTYSFMLTLLLFRRGFRPVGAIDDHDHLWLELDSIDPAMCPPQPEANVYLYILSVEGVVLKIAPPQSC